MSDASARRLLIVEDDPGLQSQMRWFFDDIDVSTAANEREAIAAARRYQPSVVTLDLGLPPDPGGTSVGFQLLREIRALLPATKVIVITGREERAHALRAIAEGAHDFYQKPIDAETLKFAVTRAFQMAELEAENRRLAEQRQSSPLEGIIAASRKMLDVCRTAERVAPTDATVLILGETGTGKELVAKAVHSLSERRNGPFVAINCAAIPETLLESELFGHEKGAFTGAVARKTGKIENANGGTLFLDEIGDMPLLLQAKILRFLQERTIERVGGHTPIPVDVRVVSATHRQLSTMITEGSFREDLFFRIAEIKLAIPALRDREGDPVLLAHALIRRFAPGRALTLTAEAEAAIESHSWPGNVRELENRIKRACIMKDGDTIFASDLELESPQDGNEGPVSDLPLNLRTVRERAEREAIEAALKHADLNLAKTARLLGVSRPTLYNLLDKHRIELGDRR